MTRNAMLLATVMALLMHGVAARAADAVRTPQTTISGTINAITKQDITITRSGGKKETVPVNEVLAIRFDAEPTPLNSARNLIQGGRFAEALAELAKVEADAKAMGRAEIKSDVEFFKAYAAAQTALGGAGDIAAAGRQMRGFLSSYPDSYHAYRATETLGDLFAAVNAHDQALRMYDQVAAAPWPDFKMRALVSKGRALRQQKRTEEALAAFDEALAAAAGQESPLIANQANAATLGKAECLADMQKYDEAITLVHEVIAAADPEDAVLRGRAYNALGNCQRQAGMQKEALLAFLHVDVLYYADPQAHAEALANLSELWLQADRPERAIAAKQMLQERYRDSAWANN